MAAEIPPFPGPGRTKDIALVWMYIDGTWCSAWACAFCGQGPITGSGNDNDCCGSTAPPDRLEAAGRKGGKRSLETMTPRPKHVHPRIAGRPDRPFDPIPEVPNPGYESTEPYD